VDHYRNYHWFANLYEEGNTARFLPFADVDPTIFLLAAQLSLSPIRGLHFDVGARLNVAPEVESPAAFAGKPGLDIAKYQADIMLRYSLRDKFHISAGIELLGPREVSAVELRIPEGAAGIADVRRMILHTDTLDSTINLKASAEVKILPGAGVFLKADNILNQRIYRFNHYPTAGASVTGGVKVVF
jgi:hypothetical protein